MVRTVLHTSDGGVLPRTVLREMGITVVFKLDASLELPALVTEALAEKGP
jgi:hypothetical protein